MGVDATTMAIGVRGNGTLNILDGGVVDASQNVGVGSFSGGVGVVNVNGSDSHFEVGNVMTLGVNNGGSGFLNITNGGSVNTVSTQTGAFGGTGVATINGIGSQWNHSGQLVVGNLSAGTLTVAAGGLSQAMESSSLTVPTPDGQL